MRIWSDHGDLRRESRVAAAVHSVGSPRRTKIVLTAVGILAGAAALASTGLTRSGPVEKRDCSLARYAWLPECSPQAQAKPVPAGPETAARTKPSTEPTEKVAAVEKPISAKAEEPAVPAPALPPERPAGVSAEARVAPSDTANARAAEEVTPAEGASSAESPRIAVAPPSVPEIATKPAEQAAPSESKPVRATKARPKRPAPVQAAAPAAPPRAEPAPASRYAEFRDPLTGRVYRDARMRDSGW